MWLRRACIPEHVKRRLLRRARGGSPARRTGAPCVAHGRSACAACPDLLPQRSGRQRGTRRGWRSGRLAQAPRWLQTLVASALLADDGVQGGSPFWTPCGAECVTPHAVNCGRLGRPNEHPFQGLAGIPDPLRPLENVGPSVYRCGMRQSSSSRALPIPHVPDRHAGDMRQSGHRYTSDMRVAPSIPRLPSMTDAPPECAVERADSRSGAGPCRFGRPRARPSARQNPPCIRSDGVLFFIEHGLQIGATDTPGTASALRFRLSAGTVRHRNRRRTGTATVPSRQLARA